MKLLIVDDHPVFRGGIAALFTDAQAHVVVEQASSIDEGLSYLKEHADIDVILLDRMLTGRDGLDAIAEFGALRHDLPIIVVSSSEDTRHVREALSRGALGYVPKSASPQTLLSAVQLVMSGELYVPPFVLNQPDPRQTEPARQTDWKRTLTPRQLEILRLVIAGMPNKRIASILSLSEKTVKAHISAIFRALDVVNRTQAAAVSRDAGIFD